VTTYDAGMAVPDWPGTYGYNLFAYPWTTWLFGPFDLFIEHGHRLLGAIVGLITLALAAVTWLKDDRLWFKQMTAAAILVVILQGALGGARVVLDERLVALLHGVTGPAFFGLAATMAVCSSQKWRNAADKSREAVPRAINPRLFSATWCLVGVAYLQLIVGAVMRHIPLWAPPDMFRIAVFFHLGLAIIVSVQAVLVAWQCLRSSNALPYLRNPAAAVVLLIAIQLLLGVATYVAKYAWPAWAEGLTVAASHLTIEKSLSQSLITTAHVANGSLILATTIVLAVRATRVRYLALGLGSLATFSGALRAA
jgi:cytochrome c oxidase assembly protein subunit 15